MHNHSKGGFDTDLRSLLKLQHKKVYSICRLFANTYKEHQLLFINIIAAASQNIRSRKESGNKETMLLRACINMAALHSIALGLQPASDRTIRFKSPDYQRSMTDFRGMVGDVSDIEKFRLFLEFEKLPAGELTHLTGIPVYQRGLSKPNETEIRRKNFIPYIKDKLIWS